MSTPSLPPTLFPTPEQEAELLAAIGDPNHSLCDIAHHFGCTVESLALWMADPEIAARLSATDSVTTWRTRLCAQAQLTKVVATCSNILDHFNADPRYPLDTPSAAAPSPNHPTSDLPFRALRIYLHRADSARRAATLLVRLSRLNETTRTQRATTSTVFGLSSAVNPTPEEPEVHPITEDSPRATTLTALSQSRDVNPTRTEHEDHEATENSPSSTEDAASNILNPVHPTRPDHQPGPPRAPSGSLPNPNPTRPGSPAEDPQHPVLSSSPHEHWP